ncbi:peptidyl-prolyl cis-trans isomerase-like 4 isoform X1 [Mya arenaria]|uniref:peptidyl-prolyl cis-trans isomerase-like 4 isoform X1 n=1 Tax=Mya arenaria TaxID=6604 RepID=UPI0022E63841|nr:peptidyl-prolyl cis-trans isomerase-like 4 isoform X1 [Mya arenaria]
MSVLVETSLGNITIDLWTDERPKCCKNFLKLCKIKYYNFCLFHSVQRNLVAQTGDPTGTGKGGESIYGLLYGEQAKYFDMENVPRMKHKTIGTVSMVNNGGHMHGSQFFITLGAGLDYLDGKHTVFGEVAEGDDVLAKVNESFCDKDHRPYKDIRILHTIILDDPYDDPPGLEIPDRSPEPTKEQLDSGRIGMDEDIDEFEGKTEVEVQEIMEEREARANAQILTMVGDLPEEDCAPPENVLFVCKLNPVTTDEDLEIIFSRFGAIKSCEVIRDHKTKESLQYAFIEFEDEKSCENAYFKMDNVLIDDRRIHVDFSQSVSKITWKGKGRIEYAKGFNPKGDDGDFYSNYKIKDNSRKDSRYDLVFDEGETVQQSKKKKKKKAKLRESSSEEEQHKASKPKKHKKRVSRSPERPLSKKKHRDVSSSPERKSKVKHRKQRSRSHSRSPVRRRRSGEKVSKDKHRR